MKVSQLSDLLDRMYPFALAEEWDNVGLLVGNPRAQVTGVMLAVDSRLDVLEEAKETGCNVVVVHHPPIFRPIRRIHATEEQGELLAYCLKNDLSVIALHTNLDSAEGGLNDTLCELLELQKVRPLVDSGRDRFFKLAAFVPEEALDEVREAVCAQGAGVIGDYTRCSFASPGLGTFLGDAEKAAPAVGEAGRLARTPELRLEVLLRRELAGRVIGALREAHPYEEVAYDLYPLANQEPRTGLARIGTLEEPCGLEEFSARVQKHGVLVTRLLGDPDRKIRKVAICSGAGSDFTTKACSAGADVYLTAEVKHHHGLAAAHSGMAIVEAEHFSLERVHWPKLKQLLESNNPDLKVRVSERESLLWRRP